MGEGDAHPSRSSVCASSKTELGYLPHRVQEAGDVLELPYPGCVDRGISLRRPRPCRPPCSAARETAAASILSPDGGRMRIAQAHVPLHTCPLSSVRRLRALRNGWGARATFTIHFMQPLR